MRRASLSNPPKFVLESQLAGCLTFGSDTAASAKVFVLEEDIIRLLVLPDGEIKSPPSWAIAPGQIDLLEPGRERLSVDGFECPVYQVEQSQNSLVIATSLLRLTIQLHGLYCRWEQCIEGSWQLMFADRPTQAYNFGWWDEKRYHFISRRHGEQYFGLGERSGNLNLAGRRFTLRNLDPMGYDAQSSDPLYKTIPFLLVADPHKQCFGMFYDNMSDLSIDLGCELDNYHGLFRSIRADGGDIDMYVIAGPEPVQVTQRFTWLTGKPALMPRWSLGYSGSTMTYTDAPNAQERMNDFLDKLAEHDIGCSSFHLSSGYTSIGNKRYVFYWNRDKFPEPKAFVEHFRNEGVELVPNIKPAFLRDHPRFDELLKQGFLVSDADGQPVEIQFWDEIGGFIDFTNPEAAEWWRQQVSSALLENGILSTWNDNNEYGVWDQRATFNYFGQRLPAADARPLQSLLMMRASRRAQIESGQQRPYVVTRSGMTGMHRYAQTWSGDNRTEWKTIRYNAKMGQALAISGVSNNGHDVGGFAGPKPDPELFVRWVQAGIFMPRFSIHSWNDDGTVNEPWMYPEVLPIIQKLMAFRQTIIPLLSDLLWRYHLFYQPVIRPLWMVFPADEMAWQESDSHMLGESLLLTLVSDPNVEEVEVYLPSGADWFNFWTGEKISGGRIHPTAADINDMPVVYAKAGSVVPVDIGMHGYRAKGGDMGLMVFPAAQGIASHWSYHDDDAVTSSHACITGFMKANQHVVTIEITEINRTLESVLMILPANDNREIVIKGYSTAKEQYEGRMSVRVIFE